MKCTLAIWRLCLLTSVLSMVNGDDDDYNGEVNCLPYLADKCFSDVYLNLACHLEKTENCEKRDAQDLCSASKDALSCAQDIIDTACKPEEGRTKFDAWLKGLQGIYNAVCENNFQKMESLVETARAGCWNSITFLKCVEEKTKIEHVVDMLHSKLDWNRCSDLMIAMATCNVLATNGGRSCKSAHEIINEAIRGFFTHTNCGQLDICSDSQPKLEASIAMAVGTMCLNFHLT